MPLRFSASSAERLMTCHASANLELAIPGWEDPIRDPTTGQKGIGTTFHTILELWMSVPRAQSVRFLNGLRYIADIRQTRRWNELSEQPVVCDWLDSKPQTTADIVLYLQDALEIIDLKMGVIPVEVVDNKQLLFYAASYLPLAPKAKTVTLHIVQPLANNMASWTVTVEEVYTFMEDARRADHAIAAKDLTFGLSDDGCRFCPAFPHSRGDKGNIMCPPALQLLYPYPFDENELLS